MRKVFNLVVLMVLCIVSEPAIVAAQEVVEEEGMTFIQLLLAGGPVMYPLFLCSVVAIALIIYFAFSLREKRMLSPSLISYVESALSKGDIDGAITSCKNSKSEVASILLSGLEANDRPVEKIREIMERKGALILRDIRRNIEYLNIIGVVAPMLGLLGTVMGMIVSFNIIAFKAGLGNPKLLAGGISQALVTTATGLPIGILAMSFYIYFRERLGRITDLTAGTGEKFIDLVEIAKSEKKNF